MITCAHCLQPFEVTEADRAFYDQISPVFAGRKESIPEPTHCPNCRQQRRLAIINERFLYPGKCGLCQKFTLTQYPPHLKLPIYCRDCWHSDKWDPRDYGQDFDFSRPFFEQLYELKCRVPSQALDVQGNNENSDYIHCAGTCKNSYLIMHADFCEDCYYGYGFKHTLFCVDGFYNVRCELCYDGVDLHKSYGLIGCQDCTSCSSSAFLRDCVGARDCFLSVGLRNQQYVFENQQLTKEQYDAKMAKIDLGSYAHYQHYRTRLVELEKAHTFKAFQGNNLENCFGDYLNHCKNVQNSFDCEDVEDGKYCFQVVLGGKNLYDINQYGTNLQESYECTIVGEDGYHLLFCINANINCSDICYGWYVEASQHCFGCVNIHHQKFCILNKQYTEEDYYAMVPRIIEHMRKTGEWGEFFPPQFSLFGYNKTTAQLYYPMLKEHVVAKDWKWDDYESPQPAFSKRISAARLPDHIKDIPDEIVNWAIECEVTGKLFRITERELKFYRRVGLPIPRRHPDQRHLDRFARRNPRRFWKRACGKCCVEIRTTHSPERRAHVYCEACYMKAVY